VKSGDRRWRFLSAILIVAGIVLIFVDSFSQEFSSGRAGTGSISTGLQEVHDRAAGSRPGRP
jgi:hypothetical protein